MMFSACAIALRVQQVPTKLLADFSGRGWRRLRLVALLEPLLQSFLGRLHRALLFTQGHRHSIHRATDAVPDWLGDHADQANHEDGNKGVGDCGFHGGVWWFVI